MLDGKRDAIDSVIPPPEASAGSPLHLLEARAARLLVLGQEGEHVGEDLLALVLEREGVEEPFVPLEHLGLVGRRHLAQKVLRARGVVDLVLRAKADPEGEGELRGPAEGVLLSCVGACGLR
jgi:hypothetical protein